MPISPDATDAELRAFYEDCYTPGAGHGRPSDAARAGGWRALCARGKADHVTDAVRPRGARAQRVLEVGCGDGAILGWLAADRFAPTLDGCESVAGGRRIAAERRERRRGARDRRRRPPLRSGSYDLGILSHVLEHVHEPAVLLAETARVCSAVVVEVPLEDNVSARRPASARTPSRSGISSASPARRWH